VRVAVDYQLHGVNSSSGQTKDFGGTLYATVTKQSDGTCTTSCATDFSTAAADYGSFSQPATTFPDLKTYVTGMLRFSFSGNASSPLIVTNTGNLTTQSWFANGIDARTVCAHGWDGASATISDSSEDRGPGGQGGTISLTSHGTIATTGGLQSVGILAWSTGGDGGKGGDSGWARNAKAGGAAGTGGTVIVTGDGTINTGNPNLFFNVGSTGIL